MSKLHNEKKILVQALRKIIQNNIPFFFQGFPGNFSYEVRTERNLDNAVTNFNKMLDLSIIKSLEILQNLINTAFVTEFFCSKFLDVFKIGKKREKKNIERLGNFWL